MAVAQKVGRGMKTPALLLLAALSAPAAAGAMTYYVTIAGLGGEPDYAQRFKMWAEDIDGSLKKDGGDSLVTPSNAPQILTVRPHFTDLAKPAKPADLLVVILI